MPTTPCSTDPFIQLKVAKAQLRKLKKEHKIQTGVLIRTYEQNRLEQAELRRQIASTEDKLLPAKTDLLKQLSYLVNSTSRAVRTTMWSLAPESRRGFGR